jgi:hypothetical protein
LVSGVAKYRVVRRPDHSQRTECPESESWRRRLPECGRHDSTYGAVRFASRTAMSDF